MKITIDAKRERIYKTVRLGVILMALTSMFGLLGCVDQGKQKSKEALMAEKMLKEKYKEEFITYAIGGRWGTLTNRTFTVICSPKDNPDLKFKAEVDKNGTYLNDEYVSRRVSEKIANALTKSFSSTHKDFFIRVEKPEITSDLTDSNISIEDYLAHREGARFAVFIVVSKDNLDSVSSGTMYNSLNSMFETLPKLDGGIRLYFTTRDAVQKSAEYLKENADLDAGFEKLLGNSKNFTIGFKNSSLEISSVGFEAEYNEALNKR